MQRYGSDKPDLRIDLELIEVADLMESVDFKVFAGPAADPEGRVAALCVPGGAEMSRKNIDDYTEFVVALRRAAVSPTSRSMTSMRDVTGLQSPILKFLPDDCRAAAFSSARAPRSGDLIFFGADKARVVNDALGALRVQARRRSWPRCRRLGAAVGR